MIYAVILLQIVEAEGGKMMSGRETEYNKHMPPLMTGANEVEATIAPTFMINIIGYQ